MSYEIRVDDTIQGTESYLYAHTIYSLAGKLYDLFKEDVAIDCISIREIEE